MVYWFASQNGPLTTFKRLKSRSIKTQPNKKTIKLDSISRKYSQYLECRIESSVDVSFGFWNPVRISYITPRKKWRKRKTLRRSRVSRDGCCCVLFFLSLLLSDFVQFGKNAQIRCIFFIGLASHFKLKVTNYWINTAGTQNAACCFSG